jgi:hypothetical protein
MTDITKMQEEAKQRHQEVLTMIEAISDVPTSDRASTVSNILGYCEAALTLAQISRVYSGTHNRFGALESSKNKMLTFFKAPIHSRYYHQSQRFSMDEHQNCLIF